MQNHKKPVIITLGVQNCYHHKLVTSTMLLFTAKMVKDVCL